jgi:hypothetical protein
MAIQSKARRDLKPAACSVENRPKLWKALIVVVGENTANAYIGKG